MIPRFGLLCHIRPFRFSSGRSSLVLTLRTYNVARPPCPAPLGGSACKRLDHFSWYLWLGTYSVFFPTPPHFRLWCPLRFQSSPLTHLWEGFLLCGHFFFTTPCPGRVSISKTFVSVVVFCILSYLLLKRLGCVSCCLVSSANIQKLFCGSCSTFKWSSGKFMGEKVVFLSYPSTIFRPLSTKYKLLKGPPYSESCSVFSCLATRSR